MRLIGQIITPGITQDTAPLPPGHLSLDLTLSLTAAATVAFRGNFLLNSSKTTAHSAVQNRDCATVVIKVKLI